MYAVGEVVRSHYIYIIYRVCGMTTSQNYYLPHNREIIRLVVYVHLCLSVRLCCAQSYVVHHRTTHTDQKWTGLIELILFLQFLTHLIEVLWSFMFGKNHFYSCAHDATCNKCHFSHVFDVQSCSESNISNRMQ